MKYEIEANEGKHCLECGHKIIYGRGDKKFCSNKCRNEFHNKRTQSHRTIHTRVMSVLTRNYMILKNLLLNGDRSADMGDLIQWGFNPEYMTANRKVGKKNECRCFDIKYQLTMSKISCIEYTTPYLNKCDKQRI